MKKSRNFLNKDIIAISTFFTLLFVALCVCMVVFLANDASTVINNPYNRRSENLKKKVLRGIIYSEDDDILAFSENGEDGSEIRDYPYGREFAHVVGFDVNGALGLESSYNYNLLSPGVGFFKNISNEINGVKSPGKNIRTTLDVPLQEACYKALNNISGGVIVMDPSTGSVKALVSAPDFDPSAVAENWESIISDDNNGVLFNRVTQGAILPAEIQAGDITMSFEIFTDEKAFSVQDEKDGDGLSTLYQMAQYVCAAANDGKLMKTILVSEILDADNNVLSKTKYSVAETLLTADKCAQLLEFMQNNVTSGNCGMVKSDSYDVFAIKGECVADDPEADYEYEHSYFMCIAQKDDEKIVVCVMIENKQESNTEAIEAAKEILDYYFRQGIYD